MGAHSITLKLPEPLYDQIKSQAKRARRSLEAELLRIVTTAAPSDDVRTRLSPEQDIPDAPGSRDLSLGEAAALLNVSQPYLVKLLDHGELPHREVDDRRRIELSDLVAYKQRDLARRRRILAELTTEAQDMGLDY